MGCAIVHAFNWKFDDIKVNLGAIKQAGYKGILASPVNYTQGDQWYKRYQPLDQRLILHQEEKGVH